MSTLIYAELLSNIRQVSILAELPTPSDASTEVSFQSGCKYLSLSHQGTNTKLELPGEVSATYVPQQPARGLKQISWRIPLTPQPLQTHPSFAESPSAPWSACDLYSSSSLACRACSIPIVKSGTIKTWQDLPSANWAEMMDFWHCHKPDVPKVEQNAQESGLVDKGYGANASFRAQKGVGKVDLMAFLFSKEDCAVSMVRICPALLFLLPILSLYIVLLSIHYGYQEGGLARVITIQWPCHRYNYPKPISPELCSISEKFFLQTLSSPSMGYSKLLGL